MDFSISADQLRHGLIFFLLLFASLVLRAFAQAWLADRLGDPTPREEGRVTLYPVPHIDLFGTIFLPLIFIFYLWPATTASNIYFFLAWAKPVPINPNNFTHPGRGMFFTQFAGFGMSVLLSVAAAVAGGFLYKNAPVTAEVFLGIIGLNAALMFYDLLPMPPLPGGMLLRFFGIISEEAYMSIARWGGLVVLVLLNIPFTRGLMMVAIALLQRPFVLLYSAIAQ